MHGGNVRVRGNEATVIDLADDPEHSRVCRHRLPGDVACVRDAASPFSLFHIWLTWIERMNVLFEFEALEHAPDPVSLPPQFIWLEHCVRQTKMANPSVCECPTGYATAIALDLARRACSLDLEEGNEGLAHCNFGPLSSLAAC